MIPRLDVLRRLVSRRRVEVFLVGGFLRDLALGLPGKDADFAVSRDAVPLARAFARGVRGTFVLLDAAHGCGRVVFSAEGETWTFDFSDYRGPGIAGDIRGRDFTINTLACPLAALDPGTDALKACRPNIRARADLRSRRIRHVGPRSFDDDPLRVLRCYSMMARTGFRLDPGTARLARARAKLLGDVAPERVREELFKVLESPRAAAVLRRMDRDGVLFLVVPRLRVMEKVHQGGYHHLDVWKHSLLVLESFEKLAAALPPGGPAAAFLDEVVAGGHTRRALLKLACLLHDAGKPATRAPGPEGRTTFHGHEHEGAGIARRVANDLKMAVKERHFLEDMVRLHLRPGYLANFRQPSEKAVFRFLRDARGEGASVLMLARADQRATLGPLTTAEAAAHHDAVCTSLLARVFAAPRTPPPPPLITGHDLIRSLKLKPGPAFKTLLAEVAEARHLGQVTTRAEALAFVKTRAGGRS